MLLDGAPMYFPENGSFDKSIAQMIVGDFRQLVWAIRQDITVKILDQGVIQDPVTKAIQYNLAQTGHDRDPRCLSGWLGTAEPGNAVERRPHRPRVCLLGAGNACNHSGSYNYCERWFRMNPRGGRRGFGRCQRFDPENQRFWCDGV